MKYKIRGAKYEVIKFEDTLQIAGNREQATGNW